MSTSAIEELFKEALDKENLMIDLYSSVIKKLKDKRVKKILTFINKDELVHAKNVKEILNLIKE